MGIRCKIGLFKPKDNVYKPGTNVSGSIKFAVDKVTEFTRITVSLKGVSMLRIFEDRIINNVTQIITHVNNEVIVNDDVVVKDEKFTMNIGSEEMRFHFKLPVNIPPTFQYSEYQRNESIHCSIFYYVRIKFDGPGLLDRTNSFKTEIPVESGILPVLPREPKICEAKKTLANIFSCKNHVVNLKVVLQDSVIETGGKVRFKCEVENITKIKIKSLEISLLEVYKFMKDKYFETNIIEYIEHTDFKTSPIKHGEKETFDFVIDVPSERVSLEHSQIIFRRYFVGIVAKLPFPHDDLPMAIPLQIGDIIESEMHLVPTLMVSDVHVEPGGALSLKEPPMYWEVMREETDDLFANLGKEIEE